MPTRFTIRWWLAGGLSRFACALTMRLRIEHHARIPAQGPVVIASNHLSFLDPIVLWSVIARRKRTARFLTAAEFFSNAWIGWGLKFMRQIPVRRGENDRAAIVAAEQSLRAGVLIGVFPEGKINDQPDTLLAGKRGVARLALETGAPILPIALWGPQHRLPRGGVRWGRPWRIPVALVVGEPIDPHGVHDATEDALRHLTDEVMRRMEPLRRRAKELADGGQPDPDAARTPG